MVPKLYSCSRCACSYRYKSGLSRHITVVHYNLKYHKCGNCDYRSYDKAAIKRHKRWCKQDEVLPQRVEAPHVAENPSPIVEIEKEVELLGDEEILLLDENDIIQYDGDQVEEYLYNDHTSDNTEEYIDVGGADITVAEYVTMDSMVIEQYGISGVLMGQNISVIP